MVLNGCRCSAEISLSSAISLALSFKIVVIDPSVVGHGSEREYLWSQQVAFFTNGQSLWAKAGKVRAHCSGKWLC